MPNSSARLVFAGAATFDAIALVPDFPSGDQRTVADDLLLAGGGPAATAAVTAARLGHRPSFVGAVGADPEGDRVLEWLRAEGVDTDSVQRSDTRRTGASVILVRSGSGARAIVTRPVQPLALAPDTPAADLIRTADWVHVDHIGWAAVDSLIASSDAEPAPRLSVDAGNRIDGFSPSGVALHVPTLAALADSYGPRPPEGLLTAALDDGAHTVVATKGADGCIAASRSGARAAVGGYPVEVVSTLGAGDVFHGALLSAVAHGLALDEQLAYANVAAALSCRALDGRSAVPDHDTVMATIHSDHRARYTE